MDKAMISASLLALLVVLAAPACGSDGTSGGRDAGPGGEGEETDAGTDAATFECPTAPFEGVDGCDLVGNSYLCEGTDVVPEGTNITWNTDPPTSGPSYPTPAPWGEHDTPVARGTWVHNLEIGGVVLLHNCPDGCDRDLDAMRDVLAARPGARILMTPDPLFTAGRSFAAVSWTWLHATDELDEDELLCFIDEHEGHAPEDLP